VLSFIRGIASGLEKVVNSTRAPVFDFARNRAMERDNRLPVPAEPDTLADRYTPVHSCLCAGCRNTTHFSHDSERRSSPLCCAGAEPPLRIGMLKGIAAAQQAESLASRRSQIQQGLAASPAGGRRVPATVSSLLADFRKPLRWNP